MPTHLAVCLVVNLAQEATKYVTLTTIFGEAAILRWRAWGASFTESTQRLNFLHHNVRAYTNLYVMHVSILRTSWFKVTYWPSCFQCLNIPRTYGSGCQPILVKLTLETLYSWLCQFPDPGNKESAISYPWGKHEWVRSVYKVPKSGTDGRKYYHTRLIPKSRLTTFFTLEMLRWNEFQDTSFCHFFVRKRHRFSWLFT